MQLFQGGIDREFRELSANLYVSWILTALQLVGLVLGEDNQDMYDTVEWTTQFMPKDRPRYLMGVGTPEDLVENVSRGVDMFDCVMPTRNAKKWNSIYNIW